MSNSHENQIINGNQNETNFTTPVHNNENNIDSPSKFENPEENKNDKINADEEYESFANPYPILTQYENIYVPAIFNINLKEIKNAPWRKEGAKLEDYFNYGYNEEQWINYSEKIKRKFDDLVNLVKNDKKKLPNSKNELKYLMEFPSDYGGLGEVYDDQRYEEVNLFDNKTPIDKLIPQMRYTPNQIYVNLEERQKKPETPPKNIYNPNNKYIYTNPRYIKPSQPSFYNFPNLYPYNPIYYSFSQNFVRNSQNPQNTIFNTIPNNNIIVNNISNNNNEISQKINNVHNELNKENKKDKNNEHNSEKSKSNKKENEKKHHHKSKKDNDKERDSSYKKKRERSRDKSKNNKYKEIKKERERERKRNEKYKEKERYRERERYKDFDRKKNNYKYYDNNYKRK